MSVPPCTTVPKKLSEAFDEFINYATLERCLEPLTIRWYQTRGKRRFKYLRYKALPLSVETLTTEVLREFFIDHRQKGSSSRNILNCMQAIKAFCTFLVKRGHLSNNPFDHLEKPRLKRKLPEFLDEDESRELLQACIGMKSLYKSRWSRDIAIVALFHLSSLKAQAREIAKAIRTHWEIESKVHGCLDVIFREDQSTARVREAARDFALLRRLALNMLQKNVVAQKSINMKRPLAGGDPKHLELVLAIN